MDGYEATRTIRDSKSRVLNHNVPIIAMTAHAMVGDAEKCFAAGMSDYISKPIDPRTLSQLVKNWLARKVHSSAKDTFAEHALEFCDLTEQSRHTSPVFSCEAFLERMMGDREFAREIASGFMKEMPTLLREMKEKVTLGALDSIWKHAHKMKGSAVNVGGEALRDVAFEIEQAGKVGDLARVVRSLPELEVQSSRLTEALQKWLS